MEIALIVEPIISFFLETKKKSKTIKTEKPLKSEYF